MDLTTDKLRSLVRKWQTLIEATVDVKTTDGYFLRMFCISFTKKRPGQVKKTAYAQSSQVRGAGPAAGCAVCWCCKLQQFPGVQEGGMEGAGPPVVAPVGGSWFGGEPAGQGWLGGSVSTHGLRTA
jgi:hypothetical protein